MKIHFMATRRPILAFAALTILCTRLPAPAAPWQGSGTPEDPYTIADANDLNALAANPNDLDKHFILTADIDLTGITYTTAVIAPDMQNTYTNKFDGAAFTGVFDANGHPITNFTIDTGGVSADYLGLFGQIGAGGQVKNLGLENVTIISGYDSRYLGGLVGQNSGNISNCYSTGAVTGSSRLGVLVGYNDGLGGLVGYNDGGTISNCYSTVFVTGGYYSYCIGSLVGKNEGSIRNCYSTGAVRGGDMSYCLGGLLGWNDGIISNCYSTGAVTGRTRSGDLGGLVGYNHWGTISTSYSTGLVAGGEKSWYVGGLVGYNHWGTVSNCYSTGSVTGGYGSHSLGGRISSTP